MRTRRPSPKLAAKSLVSFYTMVERVAADRGINPDTPRHLRKVTETV